MRPLRLRILCSIHHCLFPRLSSLRSLLGRNFLDPADDLAIGASVGLFDANYQRQWLHSPETQDPSKPLGQKYGWPADSQHHRAEDSYASRGEVNVCFGSLADISERIRYVRFGS